MMLPGLYEDGYHGMNEIPEMGEMFLAMQRKKSAESRMGRHSSEEVAYW